MRIACVLDQIHTFLQFHHYHHFTSNDNSINLVVLGAGLDVTGLWALLETAGQGDLEDENRQQSAMTIHVVEVDRPDVCATKQENLLSLGIVGDNVAWTQHPLHPNSAVAFQATRANQSKSSFYSLLSVDLGDPTALEQALNAVGFDSSSRSTMVMLELVLAYLTGSECNLLLQWCASHVMLAPTSFCVVYDILGSFSQQPLADNDDD